MIEILGLILKNYHSSLRGPLKLSIAEEAYNLGLRSLNPFFKLFEEHTDYVVRIIQKYIRENKIVKESRIEHIASRFLFMISTQIAFGFIKNISKSLGSENLSETFNEIKEKSDAVSFDLVNISIKLDYYRDFPYDEIRKLKNKLIRVMTTHKKKGGFPKEKAYNILPFTLLRQMVIQYLYMFPTTVREKQRICNTLEIPMYTQRLIDVGSTQKKRAG